MSYILDNTATQFLTRLLCLPIPDVGQAWETESADATRLDEFIRLHECEHEFKPAIKIALMDLILESYGGFLCSNNTSDASWKRILTLLKQKSLLYRQLIESWQLIQKVRAEAELKKEFVNMPSLRSLPLTTSGQCSQEEYLALDQSDPWKNEYYNGTAYQMPQIPYQHQALSQHIIELLRRKINKDWFNTLGGRMRLSIPNKQAYFFPDITVVGRNSLFQDEEEYNLLNPVCLVEISSPNSRVYDSSTKATHYLTITSLREYLRLDTEKPHAELYSRAERGMWILTEFLGLNGTITLPSVNATLSLSELYKGALLP